MLVFSTPSSMKDIYRDQQLNLKSGLYGTGALGPPSLVTTLEGDQHRGLRKALANAPWTIGPLKNAWESRFDDQVSLFIKKMNEHAEANRTICISDKVAHFAADILGMISFSHPFGSVENQRDEKELLANFRKGLTFFGFAGRSRFFRDTILRIPVVGQWWLPVASNDSGIGWLMCEADRQVSGRERENAEKQFEGQRDFLQYCLDARYSDGSSLTPVQKRAHVTLLIQAGADTTGTGMGSTLRFILTNPAVLARVRSEIEDAEASGLLSTPIRYDETREHLPFFVACIKESLRLNPPAPNLFPRIVPKGGKVIDGHFVPAGTEVTNNAWTIQRNKDFYGADAEEFKPERWMENEQRSFRLEAAQFTFGAGPRVCLGKEVAMLEMHKLLPEIIRRFDMEVKHPGKYIVNGGVAYNVGFLVNMTTRNIAP
ncbi:CypX Cytochrome P450 [Pyrenophora tritici-repentis]|uniref:CypX, Cytochrome P450 n=2 Tax=Pyrenophora tritici-repentis TaxID=45151 RepID=A0A2W1FB43_9PLEO|nr:pisatin demethylase [Pyrenophora tritici-repentis Pt-1C-BFP]KAA8627354.1 Pisatin demethylase [Pyrenophora tritici-repentis]EDU41835.1 pisatin demethylase [Pyrenophora tritici-repentis Pt-1C-BFP]KAF7442620.1 Pisatin demethylase [Pyrenophora tritici-repentis]KAF7579005.1 CypX, Cytochrome P450 [Pyrenophora tritici-repentis]KAG9377938.1 Pisatin demethylase [Pyrenophora tritici-repentis]